MQQRPMLRHSPFRRRNRRDWFDALARQVRQLPSDIDGQMGARVITREALIEKPEIPVQFRFQSPELSDIHVEASLNPWQEDRLTRRDVNCKINLAL